MRTFILKARAKWRRYGIRWGIVMEDMDRTSKLQALANGLDALITFAEQEDDFVLAAKLDDARVRFADRYPPVSN